MVNAALYIRVSTAEQVGNDHYSLSSQLRACQELADQRGYTVADHHIYCEVESGGYLPERPKLTALREAMARRQIQVAIVYDPDRLSRKQTHVAILVEEAELYHARWEFVRGDFPRTATGTLMLMVNAFGAEREREQLRERTTRALQERVRRGLPATGAPPYGYRWNADKTAWEPVEVEATLIRQVFARVLAGETVHRIATTLADIPTKRGGLWRASTLQVMLHNPAYCGRPVANRWAATEKRNVHRRRPPEEWVTLPEGLAPPLVTPEDWEAAQRRLTANLVFAGRHNPQPDLYLLRGLVYCAACESPMYAVRYRTDAAGAKTLAYCCFSNQRPQREPCGASARIRARDIDEPVWRAVVRYVRAPLVTLMASAPEGQNVGVERALLAATIARQNATIDNLIDMAAGAESALRPRYEARLKAAGERLAELEAERTKLDAPAEAEADQQRRQTRTLAILKTYAAAIDAPLTLPEKRQILRDLGLQVRVDAGKQVVGRYRLTIETTPGPSSVSNRSRIEIPA